MTYKPKPIDTSSVTLLEELDALIELLSENTHEIWSQQRIADGWTYGPKRDDERKEHPCLVPYDQLPESEKKYDRQTAIETLKFQEYLVKQKDAGAIGVLSLDPLKNGALMVLDGELCFSLIEIMLGASNEMAPLQLDRKPTTIELNVLKSSMLNACQDIDKALEQVISLKSSIVKVESNSRLVSIADPDSEV